jgi:hypothetical protein
MTDYETVTSLLPKMVQGYGTVLGCTDNFGEWELEFPNIRSAASFADVMLADDEFAYPFLISAKLRDPVTDLNHWCVLTVVLNPLAANLKPVI